jgi:hypothetical protein
MRLAFRVLKGSNYRPDWMELGDEIERDLAAWRSGADRHFAYLRERLDYVAGHPGGIRVLREEVASLKLLHKRMTTQYAHTMDEINRKIHRYNATVPSPSLMRGTLFVDEEMHRFTDRLPAYLTY